MYKVRNRSDGSIFTVYAVSGQYFMVWDARGSTWAWLPMEECEPVEDG